MPLSDDIAAVYAAHDQALAATEAQADALAMERDTLTAERGQLTAERDALAARVADLTARVADLEQQLAALQPVTLFGASIDGKAASGQSAMLAKWGPCAGRQFFEAMSNVAPRDPRLTRLHASWKPTLAAITDAAVRAACVNLLPGDVVEVWHEAPRAGPRRDPLLAVPELRRRAEHGPGLPGQVPGVQRMVCAGVRD